MRTAFSSTVNGPVSLNRVSTPAFGTTPMNSARQVEFVQSDGIWRQAAAFGVVAKSAVNSTVRRLPPRGRQRPAARGVEEDAMTRRYAEGTTVTDAAEPLEVSRDVNRADARWSSDG